MLVRLGQKESIRTVDLWMQPPHWEEGLVKTIIPLSTPAQPELAQVGGKARALITTMQQGLPVPDGFVLTVEFFQPWVASLQTTPAWQAIMAGNDHDWGRLASALQAHCQILTFSAQQRAAFNAALVAFFAEHDAHLFAVRSSSPHEDLDGASFAGGYETTLGVAQHALEQAVGRSFASSFDERVFVYKKEHGFSLTQPRIAVIVQQQIAADAAGVAFSLNPLNNCYDEAVINANYGLGESVVAGVVEPDHFVVDKVGRSILNAEIGAKETIITLNEDGGTTHTTRAADPNPCLTPDQVLTLTDLLSKVERLQHKPVDIEWAFADGALYLLQARPITTYLPLPEKMVTPPGAPKYLYADSTLIEQGLDKPLSVLGIDFVRYVLKQMTASTGGSVDSVEDIAFTAGGRYYMNLSHSIKLMGRRGALAPGSAGDASVMRILDSIDLAHYLPADLPPALKAMHGKMPLQLVSLGPPLLKAGLRPKAYLRQYQERLPAHRRRFDTVLDRSLSLEQQAIKLTNLLGFFFVDFGIPMVLVPQFAYGRIRKMFANDDVEAHLLSLGTALPGNVTAAMGTAMAEMAASETIAAHDSGETFVKQLNERTLDPGFSEAWDRFMAEYGARCPREIDVATIRPNEDPVLLFNQLKDMARANGRDAVSHLETGRLKREAAYQALRQSARKKGRRTAQTFDHYYRIWVTLGGNRENGKHYIIKVVDMFRKRVLEISSKWVAGGRLDHPEQIFDLTIDDIDSALNDATLDLRALAQERTREINRIKRSAIVARVLDSRGKVFYPPRAAAAANELVGVPISPGIVQGRVKVLRTANEKPLLPGEILVARATDPGWTPLFINAGGVILEIGGALQHGAVVAREYGLPCVSGVDGATDSLQDGQLVEIDGANGIVRLLDETAVG